MLGALVKTLNQSSHDWCWFLDVHHSRSGGPSALNFRYVQITLRSWSPHAAIHTNKRQKTKAYIIFSTVHARQQLARWIIYQESVGKSFSLERLDETYAHHSWSRVWLDLLEQATEPGSRSFAWHSDWTGLGQMGQDSPLPFHCPTKQIVA